LKEEYFGAIWNRKIMVTICRRRIMVIVGGGCCWRDHSDPCRRRILVIIGG
jgi:hypothetical protein